MFPKIGVPQNGWFRMIWGYHYFRKHPYKYISETCQKPRQQLFLISKNLWGILDPLTVYRFQLEATRGCKTTESEGSWGLPSYKTCETGTLVDAVSRRSRSSAVISQKTSGKYFDAFWKRLKFPRWITWKQETTCVAFKYHVVSLFLLQLHPLERKKHVCHSTKKLVVKPSMIKPEEFSENMA